MIAAASSGFHGRIGRIKAGLTINDVAEELDLELLGEGRSFLSPFRIENRASFSVFDDGHKFKDFATLEGGDVIDFFQKATDSTFLKALDALDLMLDKKKEKGVSSVPVATIPNAKVPIIVPELLWDEEKAKILAEQRAFSIEGLKAAFDRGVFGFGTYNRHFAWIISDSRNICAQARRLDGCLWRDPKTGHKAECLKNSETGYPVGLAAIGERSKIVLCEGGPDFLAAFHFAAEYECLESIAPIAMLGASTRIADEYLSEFKGKTILIPAHADMAGQKALENWGLTLVKAGATVLHFDFSAFQQIGGAPVNDLADFIKTDPQKLDGQSEYLNPFYSLLQIKDKNVDRESN